MKKVFKTIVSIVMAVVMLAPTALAASEDIPEWEDLVLTDEEVNAILQDSMVYTNAENARASDLISAYGIAISKSGTNTLYVTARTTGTTEVVKCGFKEIIIQRRANSSSSWTDYVVYEDLYIEQVGYTVSKSLTVPTGYQYRATCIHYAKKNIFSVQKIDNVSNVLTF